MKQKISITIDTPVLRCIDSIIDNIYIRNRSQAIEHLVNLALGENRAAVILAGGPEKNIKIGNDKYQTIKAMKSNLMGFAIYTVILFVGFILFRNFVFQGVLA